MAYCVFEYFSHYAEIVMVGISGMEQTDREFAPGLEGYVEQTLHGAKRLHTLVDLLV